MTTEAKKPKKKKKKLGSFPYRSLIFSCTLALIVMGLFGAVIIHANVLSRMIRENLEVQVFLTKRVTENERLRINKTLSAKPWVYKKDSEVGISYISKEETARKLIDETGEDFLNILDQNPFPDAYRVRLDPGVYEKEDSLGVIQSEIESLSGVDEVSVNRNLISEINDNKLKISIALLVLGLLLISIVAILVNNTIKLALFSQRFLIRSMQLVGATRGFIQKPFLMRSLLYGTIAGLLAAAFVYGLLETAYNKLEDLALLRDMEMLAILGGSLILFGSLVSFLSTWLAVRKYLNMTLDELY